MFNNLIEGHAIFADLVTTARFFYLFTRGILSKICLSSVNYKLDTGMLIEIHIRNYLTVDSMGGGHLSISQTWFTAENQKTSQEIAKVS